MHSCCLNGDAVAEIALSGYAILPRQEVIAAYRMRYVSGRVMMHL